MPSKFDPARRDILVSPERHKGLDPNWLISLTPMRRRHWVADIGCGPGFLTIPLARYVRDGKVFALDVQQEMLDATEVALDSLSLGNVELILSEEVRLPLEDESLDGAVIAFVLQEAEDPRGLLAEAHRCLKASGWLAILEWVKGEMEEGPPVERRIDAVSMRALTDGLGFVFDEQRQLNEKQYMVQVRKGSIDRAEHSVRKQEKC